MKQDPGADLVTTVLDIAKKMGVIIQKEQVLSVNCFRLPNATANIRTPVSPVLVKLTSLFLKQKQNWQNWVYSSLNI